MIQNHHKLMLSIALALGLAACSSTETNVAVVDAECVNDATQMRSYAEQNGSLAQLQSAANTLRHCVALPLPKQVSETEREQVMQVVANTTLTYFKAGDIPAAKQQLALFESHFAGQDLYLPDYTSFIDTANALLAGSSLSTQQLASLNISRELRQEIERQQYWLNH